MRIVKRCGVRIVENAYVVGDKKVLKYKNESAMSRWPMRVIDIWQLTVVFCAERTTNMMPSVDAKVAAVYASVGKLLSSYRSGKVPKAFKVCVGNGRGA